MIISWYLANSFAQGIDIDIKCTLYEHSDDVNGNNVDVRIFVMGLEPNNKYTAKVIAEHNRPTSVTTNTDYDGIFWVIAKIPNGEKSMFFNVDVHEGNSTDGPIVASGDDDAPCYGIASWTTTSPSVAISR
jgi:hypothetical protein